MRLCSSGGRTTPSAASRLGVNFSWSLAGNVFYTACQWMLLMLLAKLGTPETVGQYSLGLAISAPIVLGANLQLRSAQASDSKGEFAFPDYLAVRLATSVLALVLIALISLTGDHLSTVSRVIVLVGLSKVVEAVSDIFYGLFHQRERMDLEAKSLILRGGLGVSAAGLLLYLTHSITWFCVGLVLAWVIVLIGHDIPTGMRLLAAERLAPPDPRAMGALVRATVPLGLVALLVSLNANIPRYYVETYMDTEALGIYSALAYISVAGNMVVKALAQSGMPRLARLAAGQQVGQFVRLLGVLCVIACAVGVGSVALAFGFGPEVLVILYGDEYAAHNSVFVWILVGATASYVASVLNYGLTAARVFRRQVPLFVLVAATIAVTGAMFVPGLGLVGAALAYGSGMLVQAVGTWLLLRSALRMGSGEP